MSVPADANLPKNTTQSNAKNATMPDNSEVSYWLIVNWQFDYFYKQVKI